VTGLLRRASLRFYLRHPWQLGLAIAGISLGVGVYVGVSLANDSAARAFDVAAATVSASVTHRLLPLDDAIDERAYRELVLRDGTLTAAPVIEAEAGFSRRPGLRVPLLGIDPLLGENALRMAQLAPPRGGDLASLVVERGTVLLPQQLAEELGLGSGDSTTLTIGEREVVVRVIGIMPVVSADVQAEPPIVADIATAQELLGTLGRIDRIDLELTEAQARALAATPLPGAMLVAAETENSAFRELTAAFRTNLAALGLLALVVGMFLIYGTMAFAILQRTQTLGVLRTLGVSRSEILQTILWESVGLAAVATALGLVLGHLLAIGLVDLVLRTIGDLSFNAAVAAEPSPWIYAQGAALGFVATLLAAAKPALDAARIAPAAALRRAVLERRAHEAARRAAYVAVPVLAASGLVLAFGPSELYAAFAGLFGILAAGALLTPLATVALMKALDRALGRRAGISVTLAIRGVSASLSRTGVATAALAVSVATVNGVGLMIASFRSSLDEWLQTTLTADVYVNAPEDASVLSGLAASGALMALPGVEGITLTRARVVPTPLGDVAIRAVEPGARGWGLELVAGSDVNAFEALARGTGVIASERLLFASKLRVGDELQLPAPTGLRRLPIVGAFRDFNTGVPAIVMALDRYRRDWRDDELTGIGVDLARAADVAAAEDAVRSLAGPTARVRSSARIEELSLAVFDRTFKVTEVLRVLAGIVAFFGILSALLAIELERARELGVLRTLGFTPSGLGATLLTQTGLLGLAAGLAAAPIGTALALLLVHVINRRSFGWTMDFVVTPQALASGVALAVMAALLAGIYPAWRAARIELGAALRED
jgi:putative ABC transport system permease protein